MGKTQFISDQEICVKGMDKANLLSDQMKLLCSVNNLQTSFTEFQS